MEGHEQGAQTWPASQMPVLRPTNSQPAARGPADPQPWSGPLDASAKAS